MSIRCVPMRDPPRHDAYASCRGGSRIGTQRMLIDCSGQQLAFVYRDYVLNLACMHALNGVPQQMRWELILC